jgi:hypothetical protein
MTNAIPQTGKITKDAKECIQECVNDICIETTQRISLYRYPYLKLANLGVSIIFFLQQIEEQEG